MTLRLIPFLVATAIGIVPGTVQNVWIGVIGRTAAEGGAGVVNWILLLIGLGATVVLTVWMTRQAKIRMKRQSEEPAAGLHFVVFTPTADDFHRTRLAMDGVFPDGTSIPLAPRARGLRQVDRHHGAPKERLPGVVEGLPGPRHPVLGRTEKKASARSDQRRTGGGSPGH